MTFTLNHYNQITGKQIKMSDDAENLEHLNADERGFCCQRAGSGVFQMPDFGGDPDQERRTPEAAPASGLDSFTCSQ